MVHGTKMARGEAGFLDFYVAKGGNQMIEAALRKRGLAARAALKAHEDDPRRIYTEGPKAQMVAALCCDILTASKRPEAAARDRQLIVAAYYGDLPAARKLVGEGADVDGREGEEGKDVFHNHPLTPAMWTPLIVGTGNEHAVDQIGGVKPL